MTRKSFELFWDNRESCRRITTLHHLRKRTNNSSKGQRASPMRMPKNNDLLFQESMSKAGQTQSRDDPKDGGNSNWSVRNRNAKLAKDPPAAPSAKGCRLAMKLLDPRFASDRQVEHRSQRHMPIKNHPAGHLFGKQRHKWQQSQNPPSRHLWIKKTCGKQMQKKKRVLTPSQINLGSTLKKRR